MTPRSRGFSPPTASSFTFEEAPKLIGAFDDELETVGGITQRQQLAVQHQQPGLQNLQHQQEEIELDQTDARVIYIKEKLLEKLAVVREQDKVTMRRIIAEQVAELRTKDAERMTLMISQEVEKRVLLLQSTAAIGHTKVKTLENPKTKRNNSM
jgi:hypothetical protein